MLQSCWQISSKVILLPIRYIICIFINKQVDIYSLAKLQYLIKHGFKYEGRFVPEYLNPEFYFQKKYCKGCTVNKKGEVGIKKEKEVNKKGEAKNIKGQTKPPQPTYIIR